MDAALDFWHQCRRAAAVASAATYFVTGRSIRADRDRAREERRTAAYIDLMRLLTTTMHRVESSRPRIHLTPVDDVPEIHINEETEIKAAAELMASQAVRDLFEDWRAMVSSFVIVLGSLEPNCRRGKYGAARRGQSQGAAADCPRI